MIASQYPDWANVAAYCCIAYVLTLYIAERLGSNPDRWWIYKRQMLEVFMVLAGIIGPAISLGLVFERLAVGAAILVILPFPLLLAYRMGRSSYRKRQDFMSFQWEYMETEERKVFNQGK